MSKLPIYYPIPKEIDEDVARLYAHIMCDGWIEKGNWGYSIKYFNKEIALINNFRRLINKIFGKESKIIKDKNNVYNVYVYSRLINKYFQEINIGEILNSNNKIKSSFLQACFDDDGCIDHDGTIRIGGWDTREKIIIIKQLMNDLGFNPIEFFAYNKFTYNNYYYIRILKKENQKFYEYINFYHPIKKNKLERELKSKVKKCIICKKIFISIHKNQKYCKQCKK